MFLKALCLALALSFGAHAQTSPTDKETQKQAEKQRKEQAKAEQRAAKEAKKAREREEKERLKRPAEIQINAPADKVGAIIVQTLNRYGYQIAEEGKYRMVFTQEVTGFRGGIISGLSGSYAPPLRTAAFTISQLGEQTTVSVDMSVQLKKNFGRVDRVDMNKNKRWRQEMGALLYSLKMQAEQ